MSKENSYKDYILYDVLGHIPGLHARAMFGGWGIYKDTSIIGIIVDGELYLKADQELQHTLTTAGHYPFSYERNGKVVSMAYMNVTEEEMESPERMEFRVERSYQVARRMKK